MSNKTNLTATVFFPQSASAAGRETREFIRPGAEPSTPARQQKKTEYLLTRMGFLPPGWVTVPGTYTKARLDAYGNMPGSYYKQIIRNLSIKNTRGPPKPVSMASRNRAARMGVETEFFAVPPGKNALGRNGGHLPAGVYKRQGRGGKVLLQYLIFVARAKYRQRLDIQKEATEAIAENLNARFGETMQFIKDQVFK
jgi:hypothetical protein